MRASLTLVTAERIYLLRLHQVGDYPDPYDGMAVALRNGDVAEIQGLTIRGAYTITERREIERVLREKGVTKFWYERRPDPGAEPRRLDVKLGDR